MTGTDGNRDGPNLKQQIQSVVVEIPLPLPREAGVWRVQPEHLRDPISGELRVVHQDVGTSVSALANLRGTTEAERFTEVLSAMRQLAAGSVLADGTTVSREAVAIANAIAFLRDVEPEVYVKIVAAIEFSWDHESYSHGWWVVVTWRLSGEVWWPFGIGIVHRGDPPERVTATKLRELAVGHALQIASDGLSTAIDFGSSDVSVVDGFGIQLIVGESHISFAEQEGKPGRRREYGESHFASVADSYKRAQVLGRSPVVAVRQEVRDVEGKDATHAQAKSWVRTARKLGLI